MNPDISIIVPSRGRAEKLSSLLNCLARQAGGTRERFEVIIGLDGYHQREVRSLPRDYPFAVDYIVLAQVGISAAKNAAVARARGELLLFLNDDVEPVEDFVHQHATAQSSGSGVVLGSSPWRRLADQRVFDECIARTRMIFFYEELDAGQCCSFRHAWNLNLSIRRELLSGHGGPFAEALRPCMYEDVELAFRLMGMQDRVCYHPAALAEHNHRYALGGYFEREALLGVMAPVLWDVNADCFRAILGADLPELIERARMGGDFDVPDARRCLAHISRAAMQPWSGAGRESAVELLYAAHLPLKRRAFRCGLLAAIDHPDWPWNKRPALAVAALREDPAFAAKKHLAAQAMKV